MSPFPLEHLNTHKHGGSFLHSSSAADSGRAVCKRAVPGTSEQPTAESPASPPPTGVSTPHSPWRVSNLRALRWASPPTVCAALQPKRVSDLSALRWTPPPTVCAALQPTRVDRRRTVRHRKSGCPLSIGRLRLYAILIGFRESLFLDGQDQHGLVTVQRRPTAGWNLVAPVHQTEGKGWSSWSCGLSLVSQWTSAWVEGDLVSKKDTRKARFIHGKLGVMAHTTWHCCA